MTAALHALLIDIGGTLVDQAAFTDNRERYEQLVLARLRGAFGMDHEWFTTLIRYPFAEPEAPRWEQRTNKAVAALLQDLGVDAAPEDVERICRACAVPLGEVIELADGAREAIRAIRRLDIRMVTCSNTWWRNDADSRRDWEQLGVGDLFDAHVTSLDTGFAKPHPAIFHRALAAVGVLPSEAAIIGDRLDRDIAGAHAVGMRAIWLRPPAFVGAVDPAPDAEVTSWAEVPPIIQAWREPPD